MGSKQGRVAVVIWLVTQVRKLVRLGDKITPFRLTPKTYLSGILVLYFGNSFSVHHNP